MKKAFIVKDTYRHRGLRRKLVEELRKKGISDERVLDAVGRLPRHFFLDPAFDEWAYRDKPFPIGNDQTISQPFTVAYMTQLLQVEKSMKVLEIGTGSGYQAALLSIMGARVYTIERQEFLFHKAKKLLDQLRIRVRCFYRDGFNGLPEFSPFDRILVTAGSPQVPDKLLQQLDIPGIMVIPIGQKVQRMQRILRKGEQEWSKEVFGEFRFVPFLQGTQQLNPNS